MEKPITTIENLAEMIQRTMASKEDIKAVHNEVAEFRPEVDHRLDKIDNRLMADHERRIKQLEAQVKRLTAAPAV